MDYPLEQELIDFIEDYYRGSPKSLKRRNINPKTWGPHGWKFIDKIVQGYPTTASPGDRMAMLQFITSFTNVLPCKECREKHITFSSKYPPVNYVGGRVTLRRWFKMYRKASS
ncbi:sulfhydryl oxidase [Pinkberry virus LS07-2018-MD00]|jgi:hypothetical protein|nr:sulfhydryl oxidase [Pinkberry virus LS07-2018-MD00]